MIRTIQTVGIIGFFVCLTIMYLTPYGVRGIRSFDPTFQMPDMKFHYSVEQLTLAFEKIGSNGRDIYQKYLVLDCAFVFCFGIIMLTITNYLFTGLPRNILIVVCVLRGVFDLLENCFLILVLKNYPDTNKQFLTLCSFFTTIKFIMLYIWIASIILQIMLLVFLKMQSK